MKLLFIPILLLVLGQNEGTTVVVDMCKIELSRSEILANIIELHCSGFNDDQKFFIKDFTIKLPGQPSEEIKGTRLSGNARTNIETNKELSQAVIFDIKYAYQGEEELSTENIPYFEIQFVE